MTAFALGAKDDAAKFVYIHKEAIAIHGYDTVAYQEQSKAARGDAGFAHK